MAPIEGPNDSAKVEDTPVVKELKEIDDQYLAIEKEYEKAVSELQKKFDEQRKPFLDERKQVLLKPRGDATDKTDCGTPGCPGFWCEALKNHPAFGDSIQKWDEPVLEFLQDIVASQLDEHDRNKGFKLVFHFAENPYFTNAELFVECHMEESNPYLGDLDAKEVKSSAIDWKPGKDVTVRKADKKVKGGGAKKTKKKNTDTRKEPQQSFFGRFMNIKEDGEVDASDVLKCLPEEAAEEIDAMDEDELCEMLLEQVADGFNAIQENIIPFAVRWFTGEADPRDSDSEFSEDPEEEDADDDSDEEPAPKAKGKAKAKKSPKKSPASSPNMKPSDQPKEECKQQ